MEDFESGRKDVKLLNTPLFPKPYLLKTLKHCYNAKPTGAQKMSKEDVYNEVMKCFEAGKAVTTV